MNYDPTDRAKEIAYNAFVNEMTKQGFGRAMDSAKPCSECRAAAGILVVPLVGLSSTSNLQSAMERAGYEHEIQQNYHTDAPEFVALVPFMKEVESGIRARGPSRQRAGGFKISYLLAILFLVWAFAIFMTPRETLVRLWG